MPDTTPLQTRHGSNSGQPITRRDGLLKVTGRATFAADNHPEGMLYAVYASSRIGRGRVTALDVAAAKAHPGVVEVMTPENRPPLAQHPDAKNTPFDFCLDLLQDDTVRYANQPVAVVIAETLEAATEGAALLAPQYEVAEPRIGIDAVDPYMPQSVGFGPPDTAKGDAEAVLAEADILLDATWETPAQYHNAMEPHGVVADWQAGGRLVIDTPSQGVSMAVGRLAGLFGIDPGDILIRSPFLGGGFGSKGLLSGPQVLGVLAAKLVGKPVKLVLRRDQMFGPVGHRPATRQRLRMGTDADGHLTAITHEVLSATSSFDEFIEPAGNASLSLYNAEAMTATHRGVRNDIGTPMFMRAPGEASGSAALECAIDEAAEQVGMDPLDFRLANYAEVETISGKPFSSKALRECYGEAAKAFGWDGRPLQPRQMRDDQGHLIGWGMGTATFPCPMFEASARATLRRDGTGLMETSACDMGQGAQTALAQIAADSLGIGIDQLEFRVGDSDLPDAGIAGGSGHTATAGSAIHGAGGEVVARLAALAVADPASPLYGAGNAGVVARDGRLHSRDDESRSESYAEILARAGMESLEGEGTSTTARSPADVEAYAMHSHGAVFAEVRVDPELGQVRVSRLVGAFAAGRIINPRLVDSQLYGGMIWGSSFALNEETVIDPRSGRIMNADFAEYQVAVNADVPSLEVIQIPEEDPFVNTLGVKGVGEIGITGTVGAIANAIWHATGVRIRRFPVRPEDLVTRQ